MANIFNLIEKVDEFGILSLESVIKFDN